MSDRVSEPAGEPASEAVGSAALASEGTLGSTSIEECPTAQEAAPSSDAAVALDTDKPRGLRNMEASNTASGPLMQLDDALQRALEHPKYRMTALRFEETFIDFIKSGEQRMVIDESLTGFGKCIAHRVAKLYGLETLTVLNSENIPTVGVRRTKKSVTLPRVKLRDMYKVSRITHPWEPAPHESPELKAVAAQLERSAAEPAAAAAAAAPAAALRGTPAAHSGGSEPPAEALPAVAALQPQEGLAPPEAGAEAEAGGKAVEAAAPAATQRKAPASSTAQQHASVEALPGPPVDEEGAGASTGEAAGQGVPPVDLQGSTAGAELADTSERPLSVRTRPDQESQQSPQPQAPSRRQPSTLESPTWQQPEKAPADPSPAVPVPRSKKGTPGMHSHQRASMPSLPFQSGQSSEQEDLQLPIAAMLQALSAESAAKGRSSGSSLPGDAGSSFREGPRGRRGGAGRSDLAVGPPGGRVSPQGRGSGWGPQWQEAHGRVMTPGGSRARTGTGSPVLPTGGQKQGGKRGKQQAPEHGFHPEFEQHEAPGFALPQREQLSPRSRRAIQAAGRGSRTRPAQEQTEVSPSPFSRDPCASPSPEALEQQLQQRLSIDTGHHMRPHMAMSEQLYRPHVRPSRLASQSSLPSSTSGTLTPHQSGYMSPMMSQSSGQLGSGQLHGHGPHAPYGPYGPMAIPPGYMLVPAPQGMSVYQPPVPVPGHPGYFFVPGAAPPAQESGPMPLHSAQQGVMWEQPGPGYGPGPLGSMQGMGMAPHQHGRQHPGMPHQPQYMPLAMEHGPPMWPAQAHAHMRLSPPQHLDAPEEAQGPSQQQGWQADPQPWQGYASAQMPHQMPPQRAQYPGMQRSNVTSPTTRSSGGLSSQHSGEHAARRGQSGRQQSRQQPRQQT